MKKFLTFVAVTMMMIAIAGCEVRTRTVLLPKQGTTIVHKSQPTTTTTVVTSPSPPKPSTTVVYEDSHHSGYFYCDDGSAIPSQYVCDGWDDCWQGEDEHFCGGSVVVVEEY